MYAQNFNASDIKTDSSMFRAAISELPGGVNAITCLDQSGHPVGATLSAVTSLSLDPPMILACFDSQSRTLDALRKKDAVFLAHVLADGQEGIAGALASKRDDKFDDVDWDPGYENLPQINDAAVVIACTVCECVPAGDHVIVTGDVNEVFHNPQRMALLYHRSTILPISMMKETNR